MHHVTEHSEYIDDYTHQPIPFARSEYLLYNVNDDHGRYGSIVEQQGIIENQSSMLVKQHYPEKSTIVSNEVDDDFIGSWVTITFMSQSTAQLSAPAPSPESETTPPIEAVIDLPPPTPESGDPAGMRSRAKDKKVKERRKRSRKSKKERRSKKEKSLPKIRKGSKKSDKSKKRDSSKSKKKRSKDKTRSKSRRKSPKRMPVERKKRKHWIEEEFLQQAGVQGEKLEHKKEPEAQEKEKKKSNEPVLPVMDTQQGTSESKEKKKSDERMTGVVAPESPGSLPPMPPPPAEDYFRIKPAEGDKRRTDLEGMRDKIYGIKPEKPPERLKSSPPLQRTQDDESGSKPKVSSQKESVSISVTGLPLPTKVSGKKRETPELPAVGDRLRVNIDEILRLGAIMERRSMSAAKKASFEWIALNRTTVKDQPEAFSSHLISAVGDVRLEKSLACDALNVLMYQHTVTPDEYLRLCQHLETVQTITIGLLAQILRTNTQYYSSLGSQRSDALNMDVYR